MADQSGTDAESPAWAKLGMLAKSLTPHTIKDLFKADSNRLAWGLAHGAGLTLDITKNQITRETLASLVGLTEERDLAGWRTRMVRGEPINVTEGRAALHMALRGGLPEPAIVNGEDVNALAAKARAEFLDFAARVHSGGVCPSKAKRFRTIVHIGIGGSDLGPRLATDALRPYWRKDVSVHFVANVDVTELLRALDGADPETTLFIVASKTFTTQETIENAMTARAWLEAGLPKDSDTTAHFVGVTANSKAAEEFGIAEDRIFPMWDWVGGRFSVWSAVGLSLALAIGAENFEAFLEGAVEMDRHFLTAPPEKNLPILLGLIGVWNRNGLDLGSHAVLPYHHALSLLPRYLQQLEMESNGKSVTRDGKEVSHLTVPTIWGGAGTTGQHAFYQWLHQGTARASADIILPLATREGPQRHQDILCAHAIAQAETLAFGRDAAATRAEMEREGLSEADIERLLPHRTFSGNRPVSVITLDRLTPGALGALLALYEHKVFTQGILWNINSFDQWGVELGKTAAGHVLDALTGEGDATAFDPSTQNLIKAARAARTKDTNES